MINISFGLTIVAIAILGYISNFLNWRYLNYTPIRMLYYIGALVHETSHAILCILTGARIEQFTVFSSQPQVVHRASRLPIIGEFLISAAPIAGGLLFLFLINRYLLGSYFIAPSISAASGWRSLLAIPLGLLSQINLLQWQSWIMIFLSFNAGAMLGPSMHDLKNVWFMLILSFFIQLPMLTGMGLIAISMILADIAIQIIAIVGLRTGNLLIG